LWFVGGGEVERNVNDEVFLSTDEVATSDFQQ
jgi:hypothetical protein